MADQPWYHRCEGALMFTTLEPVSEEQFTAAVTEALKPFGLVPGTLEIEAIRNLDGELVSGWGEPEPGDPSDL